MNRYLVQLQLVFLILDELVSYSLANTIIAYNVVSACDVGGARTSFPLASRLLYRSAPAMSNDPGAAPAQAGAVTGKYASASVI